jgi:hypothetical protein
LSLCYTHLMNKKIFFLRVIHGLFALYFLACLIYLYYATLFSDINIFLLIAVLSLAFEGFIVFILNKGDCPLIHIQRKIGDNTPFFNIFLPARIAKQVVPALATLTWIGVALLIIRLILNYQNMLG